MLTLHAALLARSQKQQFRSRRSNNYYTNGFAAIDDYIPSQIDGAATDNQSTYCYMSCQWNQVRSILLQQSSLDLIPTFVDLTLWSCPGYSDSIFCNNNFNYNTHQQQQHQG
eukprot:GEZU01032844.1.p1 GENE.GEZU01032844.1~~GEZU01032844.1.p1  ORF type:complete len:112 (-),score=17.65 GEZU01032844.1:281-616(-)